MSKNNETYFSEQNKKAFKFEALIAFIIDSFVLIFVWILYFLLIHKQINFLLPTILLTIVYVVVAVIFHYRVAILQFIDILKNETITQTVTLATYKVENSWSGHLGHSNISKLYPKDEMVDRFKLYYINENGEKDFVRLIMSLKKRHEVFKICENKENGIEIRYFKRSKILLSLGDFELDKKV